MAKKRSQKKKPSSGENPFNVKINRSKFSVLGQKVKGTRGLPGISHSVCNAKRKEEFHKKRMQSQKANKFVDKRFMDSSMTFEEQATLRLVEERKKKFKKNIFNLNDEENLTHKGIPLESKKNLKDSVDDSDDEEQLDSKFVKQAHFGGFDGDPSATPKSRKEIIDELIVESKRRKMERKMKREKNEDLVEKLDQQWKEMHHKLMPVIKSKTPALESDKKDPFDVLLHELKYEMKTAPPVQSKTPEEVAAEEQEKLKILEEEQNKRMLNPMDYSESKDNMLSADSLYDGLDIQFEPIDEQENGDASVSTNDISENDDESGNDFSEDSEEENDLNDTSGNDEVISILMENDPDFPDSFEKLSTLVNNSSQKLGVVIENIIKDRIRSKSKQNVQKLEAFFNVLLEYVMKSKDTNKIFKDIDEILPHLYSVAQISPVNTAVKLLTFLDKEQELFQQSKGKKMKKNFPRLQSLGLFKIVSSLYSVSDFKHPVVTPTIVFMCDVLSSPFVASFQNVYSRILISKIVYDCVSYSKRYVPEVLCFINKTLELTLVKNKKFNLFIDESVSHVVDIDFEKTDKSCDCAVKSKLLSEVIELLQKFSVLYDYQQCFNEIFAVSQNIINKIVMMDNFTLLSEDLRKAVTKCVSFLENVKKTYKPLVYEKKKPVPLKLFEPAFDSKYTKKRDDIQKKRKLVKSVNQKIKKEEKGLLREMRRDNQVIAAEKLKEKLEADEDRKRKVKQLYSELAMQEGEFKKYMKKK